MSDEIEDIEIRMKERSTNIAKLEEFLSDFKDKIYLEVDEEYFLAGKPAPNHLSNEDKRKIEVKRRLKAEPDYINALNMLEDAKEIQTGDDINLRTLKRQFIRDYCQGKIPI